MTVRMRKWILLAFALGFIFGGITLFFMMPALVEKTAPTVQNDAPRLETGEMLEEMEPIPTLESEALPLIEEPEDLAPVETPNPSEMPRDQKPDDGFVDMSNDAEDESR